MIPAQLLYLCPLADSAFAWYLKNLIVWWGRISTYSKINAVLDIPRSNVQVCCCYVAWSLSSAATNQASHDFPPPVFISASPSHWTKSIVERILSRTAKWRLPSSIRLHSLKLERGCLEDLINYTTWKRNKINGPLRISPHASLPSRPPHAGPHQTLLERWKEVDR